MWYNINFKDNIIVVKNPSATDEIYVTIDVTETCDESVYKNVISRTQVDYEEEFKLPEIDGLYRVVVDRVVQNTVIEQSEMLYPYYGLLLETIIDEIEYFLCDCDCVNCSDDCNKDDKTYLSLLLKMFSYYTLLYKYYPRFYDAVFKCLNCSILDVTKCVLLNERVSGNTENSELFKKIISSLYSAFYYAEYYNTTDKVYIDKKFKYNKIKKCILVTNTDIECITNQIENNMGVFQLTFDRYVNQPPSEVGDYNASAGNRAVYQITPQMFTTLTVPQFADPENDSAQAIRVDSIPTNGAVLMLGSNPVTAGTIILMSTIAGGSLTIQGPNQDAIAVCTWTYSVRDTGSMQFVA